MEISPHHTLERLEKQENQQREFIWSVRSKRIGFNFPYIQQTTANEVFEKLYTKLLR